MKILTVKEKFKSQKIFSLQDIYTLFPNCRQETRYDWENQGYVKKIRNKYYVFSDQKFQDLELYMISNKIYEPSYVSLESALNHYGIIPEAVLQITAVTTRKTNNFETDFGTFIYKSIKPDLFWGYKLLEYENIGIKIADPEKSILDYLYLNSEVSTKDDFDSLRFNREILRDIFDINKIKKYLNIFSNEKLSQRTNSLIHYIKSYA